MANVQLQLSFLQPQPSKPDIAPVWTTLDNQQRAELVATLAPLIAKLATDRADFTADPADKENDDE